MDIKQGEIILGNDGKQRLIINVIENNTRRPGTTAVDYKEIRDGKSFGPMRGFYSDKLPKWFVK